MTNPLDHLRSKFLMRCAEERVLLELADPASPSAEARRAVHRLAGTAGMFGFHELGRLAAAIDDELHENRSLQPGDFDALTAELRRLPG